MASRRTTDPSGRRSDQHASLKFLCLKTLLEYVEMPKAAEVRALAGEHPDTSITVIVAPWERGAGKRASANGAPVCGPRGSRTADEQHAADGAARR
jgi:hypothetical protein